MGDKRVHIVVKGRVQGVFFRMHTQEMAESLGLTGWVRNTIDGSVETVAEGNEEKLKIFEKWCHEGPRSAQVTKIEVKYSEPKREFDSFRIKYF